MLALTGGARQAPVEKRDEQEPLPELPEVETVRRGLAPHFVRAQIVRVELRRPDLRFPFPSDFAARLDGAVIEALNRRGKYLLADTSRGDTLIMHLGMTGRFTIRQTMEAQRPGGFHRVSAAPSDHEHVVLHVRRDGKAAEIAYADPRRFGFMDLVATAALDRNAHLRGMGPEPLSDAFTEEALATGLRKRDGPIKSALLDQRLVAGIGNIYASEALFRAGISPKRRASSISRSRLEGLRRSVQEVLLDAIEAGGSTLRDFAAADGASGYFQTAFRVYDREDAPCPSCAGPIRRIVQAGRASFYCPKCQR